MIFTDWIAYKYGVWRRNGHSIQVCSNTKIMPSGKVAACEPRFYAPIGDFKYFWTVKVMGWETRTIMSINSKE